MTYTRAVVQKEYHNACQEIDILSVRGHLQTAEPSEENETPAVDNYSLLVSPQSSNSSAQGLEEDYGEIDQAWIDTCEKSQETSDLLSNAAEQLLLLATEKENLKQELEEDKDKKTLYESERHGVKGTSQQLQDLDKRRGPSKADFQPFHDEQVGEAELAHMKQADLQNKINALRKRSKRLEWEKQQLHQEYDLVNRMLRSEQAPPPVSMVGNPVPFGKCRHPRRFLNFQNAPENIDPALQSGLGCSPTAPAIFVQPKTSFASANHEHEHNVSNVDLELPSAHLGPDIGFTTSARFADNTSFTSAFSSDSKEKEDSKTRHSPMMTALTFSTSSGNGPASSKGLETPQVSGSLTSTIFEGSMPSAEAPDIEEHSYGWAIHNAILLPRHQGRFVAELNALPYGSLQSLEKSRGLGDRKLNQDWQTASRSSHFASQTELQRSEPCSMRSLGSDRATGDVSLATTPSPRGSVIHLPDLADSSWEYHDLLTSPSPTPCSREHTDEPMNLKTYPSVDDSRYFRVLPLARAPIGGTPRRLVMPRRRSRTVPEEL